MITAPRPIKIALGILLFLAVAAAGAAGGIWYDHRTATPTARFHEVRESGTFTNPLLECEPDYSTSPPNVQNLVDKINKAIQEETAAGNTHMVAVYYRDLNDGPWIGINQDSDFSPASLLKVPLMIAYYKLAEQKPEVLNQSIVFDPKLYTSETEQNYKPLNPLVPGQGYTVEDLLERMITESDNQAKNMLLANINPDTLNSAYTDLGVPKLDPANAENFMSVKAYASFFRILYNASYLDKDHSEKALHTLARSDFKNGLVRGVPENIQVAHKMGERVTEDGQKQLHDCGIVYYPLHPYLLCVMSRGSDFPELENSISKISSIVYKETDDYQREH